MGTGTKIKTVNLREYLGSEDGCRRLELLQKTYRCPLNPQIERFFREQAVEFTKKSQSVTYVVRAADDAQMLGFFTLAVKPIAVDISRFSGTVQKQILRVAQERDPITGKHRLSAFLVAQLGKNYAGGANGRISGARLLEMAVAKLGAVQNVVGGKVVFLEPDIDKKLLAFYETPRFKKFDARMSDDDGILVQLLRVI